MTTERDFVYRGLIEANRLMRRPTDRPDLDHAEIMTRLRRAQEYVRTHA